jgi:glycosyltransferase involved in cell wall biosynthesis
MPIKIEMITAQFCDAFLPVIDGVVITVKNYAQWLNRLTEGCVVVTPSFPGYQDDQDFLVFRYFSLPTLFRPPFRFGLPQVDPGLQRTLKKQSFDLIHAHSPFYAGRLALKIARKRKVPIVSTFHSKYRDDFKNAFRGDFVVDRIIDWIVDFYHSVDEVWVPNSTTGDTLRSYGFKKSLSVMENGMDMDGLRDLGHLRKLGSQELKISDDTFVFLFVGQHTWEKNHAFLIESMAQLRKKGRSFKMVFVGDGYARSRMEAMVRKKGLSAETVFMGMIRDRERLKRFYARANLFLFPSLYDNAPLAVREAAAFRVPSIVLDGSNAAEGMKDCENGFLMKNTPEEFSERLACLMDQPELVKEVGEGAGHSLCRSWREIVGEVMDRYESLTK